MTRSAVVVASGDRRRSDKQSDVIPYLGFEQSAQRWLELVRGASGTSITHFAYRMDDFRLPDTGVAPVAELCRAASDTKVTVVLSKHAWPLNRPIARRLRSAGAAVLWSRCRRLGAMHVKATAFGPADDRAVLLGSADMWSARLDEGRPFWRPSTESHEFGIEVHGDLADEVNGGLQRIVDDAVTPEREYESLERTLPWAEASVLLTGFPPPGSPSTFVLENRLCGEVDRAQHSVYIEDQYFSLEHPGGNWTSTLLASLKRAIDRGVAVVVVLPSRNWVTGRSSVMGLGTATTIGRLFEWFPNHDLLRITTRHGASGDVHSHSKLMVIDGDTLITGSANLCHRSFFYDSELTVVLRNLDAAQATLSLLVSDDAALASQTPGALAAAMDRTPGFDRLNETPSIPATRLRRTLLTHLADRGDSQGASPTGPV